MTIQPPPDDAEIDAEITNSDSLGEALASIADKYGADVTGNEPRLQDGVWLRHVGDFIGEIFTAVADHAPTDPLPSTDHFGRSFGGPGDLEVGCPCRKAPCGLVDAYAEHCPQHNPMAGKTIRTFHPAEQCPVAPAGTRPTSVRAGGLLRDHYASPRYAATNPAPHVDHDLSCCLEHRTHVPDGSPHVGCILR
jgi:hypothetical protein